MGKHVVIIGAGIVGCTTAYFLAREGVEVTVLDAVGVAAGASGRNNGMIEHPYDPATVELFQQSVALLHELFGDAMPAQPVGTLLVAESEADADRLVAHHMQFPELETQLLEPAAARAAEPMLAEGIWGCLLDTGYPVRPLEATSAFADLARQAGAEFVVGSELADSPYSTGAITAKQALEGPDRPTVVIAAGAGTASVLEGYVRPDVVAPLWGVIVTVEMAERPRYQLIEGVLTIAHGGGTFRTPRLSRSSAAPATWPSAPRCFEETSPRRVPGRSACSTGALASFLPSKRPASLTRSCVRAPVRSTTARSWAGYPVRSASGSRLATAAAACHSGLHRDG